MTKVIRVGIVDPESKEVAVDSFHYVIEDRPSQSAVVIVRAA
jgi:hypothetical protein